MESLSDSLQSGNVLLSVGDVEGRIQSLFMENCGLRSRLKLY